MHKNPEQLQQAQQHKPYRTQKHSHPSTNENGQQQQQRSAPPVNGYAMAAPTPPQFYQYSSTVNGPFQYYGGQQPPVSAGYATGQHDGNGSASWYGSPIPVYQLPSGLISPTVSPHPGLVYVHPAYAEQIFGIPMMQVPNQHSGSNSAGNLVPVYHPASAAAPYNSEAATVSSPPSPADQSSEEKENEVKKFDGCLKGEDSNNCDHKPSKVMIPSNAITAPSVVLTPLMKGTTASLAEQQQQQRPIVTPVPDANLKHLLAEASRSRRNLYIRGLPQSATDADLFELSARVLSAKVMMESSQGVCKGYGFSLFYTDAEAMNALVGLNSAGYQVSFAKESFTAQMKRLQDERSANIYISNLPLEIDEEGLSKLCEQASGGRAMSTRILRTPNNISRGVGFARMESRKYAISVIQALNGHVPEGASEPLQLRFADSESQKRLKSSGQNHFRKSSTVSVGDDVPLHISTDEDCDPANDDYAGEVTMKMRAINI